MTDSNNFTEHQKLNAARALQMIADLNDKGYDERYAILDSLCCDSYYWQDIIDWAVMVMNTDDCMTFGMKMNTAIDDLIVWHECNARKLEKDDFVAEEKIEAYYTTAQYLREYARAVKRINFLEERIAKYQRELLEKEMEAIE